MGEKRTLQGKTQVEAAVPTGWCSGRALTEDRLARHGLQLRSGTHNATLPCFPPLIQLLSKIAALSMQASA
jgi:hypothetical protein